jgi:hypothetical protein
MKKSTVITIIMYYLHLTVAQQLEKKKQYVIILNITIGRWLNLSVSVHEEISRTELELVLTCEFQENFSKQN